MSPESSTMAIAAPISQQTLQAQASQTYLALHTLGWKAFQDLCAQVCEVALGRVAARVKVVVASVMQLGAEYADRRRPG
jgi:uncharacterized membrane protein